MLFVETHERVGRRIFTRRYGATLVPIELGAEFIHESAPELTCLQAGRASSRSWCDPIKRDTPTINEPQLGDQATIFGARFRSEWFYAGAIFSILKQHEVDDRGRRFNGNGFEIALRQHFTEWAWIEGAYNDLSPDSDHPGDF